MYDDTDFERYADKAYIDFEGTPAEEVIAFLDEQISSKDLGQATC